MANNKHLGIFFGLSGLNVAESVEKRLSSHYYMPYQPTEEAAAMGNVSNEVLLTATLQKTLRENRIDSEEVFVSIPTREFIIRSFYLPALNKDELASAVEFEVRKYIPFKLEELFFDYQVTTITEGKTRKLRVLFVGIKRNILERYIYIVEQAELKIQFLEPHAVSLLRLFLMKRLFAVNQPVVIIESDQGEGTIMIVEQGLPQLIRDFKLNAATENSFTAETDVEFSRLLNEVRVSLEYFRRQNPRGSVQKLILCSAEDSKKWTEGLNRELKIQAVHLSLLDAVGVRDGQEFGLLSAYGVGLVNLVRIPYAIDLARKRFKQEPRISKAIIEEVVSRKTIARAVAMAVVIVGLMSSFNMFKILGLNNQIINLKKSNKELSSLSEKELKSMIDSYTKKIDIIQDAVSVNLVAPKIFDISMLLPEGVWLTSVSLKVDPPDSQSISFKGTAYSRDAGVELNMINNFISNLKQSVEIGKDFHRISLVSANQNQAEGNGGTNFEVFCRQ